MAEGPSIHTEELALFSKPPVNEGEEKYHGLNIVLLL